MIMPVFPHGKKVHEVVQARAEAAKSVMDVMGVRGPIYCLPMQCIIQHVICVIPYKCFPVRFQSFLMKIFMPRRL